MSTQQAQQLVRDVFDALDRPTSRSEGHSREADCPIAAKGGRCWKSTQGSGFMGVTEIHTKGLSPLHGKGYNAWPAAS